MKVILIMTSLVVILCCSGCANRNKVIVDPYGVDMARYRYDLQQCQQIAEQVSSRAGGQAVSSAVVGGLIGAAVGNSDTAKRGASVGAVTGMASGAKATKEEKLLVIKNCLRNRGYRVLN
jgi:outer membrane lipoprotein SlyB